jgi:hypothetical protein
MDEEAKLALLRAVDKAMAMVEELIAEELRAMAETEAAVIEPAQQASARRGGAVEVLLGWEQERTEAMALTRMRFL